MLQESNAYFISLQNTIKKRIREVIKIKRYIYILLTLALILTLSSCSESEFSNPDVFITRYNNITENTSLSFTDFYTVQENSSMSVKECTVTNGVCKALIRLLCSENKRIYRCKVVMLSCDENIKKRVLTDDEKAFFTCVCSDVYAAFSGFEKSETERQIDTLLENGSAFDSKSEKNAEYKSYVLTLLQNDLCCECIITNKWLCETQSTVKPESKSGFGDSTSIRTETVPLK